MSKEFFEKYPSYQDYFKNFLGAWSFEKGDKTLTIKDIDTKEMFDKQAMRMTEKTVVYFEEERLPMILKNIHTEAIEKVLGTSDWSKWVGKQIVVGASTVKVGGKEQEAIRVRTEKPKSKNTKRATIEQLEALQRLIDDGVITNTSAMLSYYKVAQIEELSEKDAAEIIKKKSNTEEDF